MTVTRCVSSQLMTSLLTWRNPEGNERHWLSQARFVGASRFDYASGHLIRIGVSQIGVTLLIITATIETVAYAALTLVSLALYPVHDRPYHFFVATLQSSSFTMIWAVTLVVTNGAFRNLLTHESCARYLVHSCAGALNQMYGIQLPDPCRLIDTRYVNDASTAISCNIVDSNQEIINQGANLLQQDVLAGANDETLEAFREMYADEDIYMFAMTKAVYVYTFGSRKKDAIPSFFTTNTQKLILSLRQKALSKEASNKIETLLTNLTEFASVPEETSAKKIYTQLKAIATEELQNTDPTSLITGCWAKATEQMTHPSR